MSPRGEDAWVFNTMAKPIAQNASYDEGSSKEARTRVWSTGRSFPGKKEDLEIEREKDEVGSEGPSSPIKIKTEKGDISEGSVGVRNRMIKRKKNENRRKRRKGSANRR